jgi:hypothetical protein
MDDYGKTKIYRMPVGDENYFGHTIQKLPRRRSIHISAFKRNPNQKVYEAMREAGMTANDIELILVEEYPCKSKAEARARERYWVENFGTLNSRLPWKLDHDPKEYKKECRERYKDQIKQYSKDYYAKNQENLVEKAKAYREKNADKVKETNKKHYEKHHDKHIERITKYRQENKEEMNRKKREWRAEHREEYNAERRANKWTCPHCDIEICRDGKARHMKRLHPDQQTS